MGHCGASSLKLFYTNGVTHINYYSHLYNYIFAV